MFLTTKPGAILALWVVAALPVLGFLPHSIIPSSTKSCGTSYSVTPQAAESESQKLPLLASLEIVGLRKEAFEKLWNSDYQFTASEYGELLVSCCRLGYVKAFQDLMDEMGNGGIEVAIETLESSAAIASSRGYYKIGMLAINRLVSQGVTPSGSVFNTVLKSCVQRRRPSEAIELFQLMKQAQATLYPAAYEHLARVIASRRYWRDFAQMLNELKQEPESEEKEQRILKFFDGAIMASVEIGDTTKAMELMRELCALNIQAKGNSFRQVLVACMDRGIEEQAIGMLKDFSQQVEWDSESYQGVLEQVFRRGKADTGLAWLEKLRSKGVPDLSSWYSEAVRLLVKADEDERALQLISEMEMRGIPPTIKAINAMLLIYSKQDKYRELDETFKNMEVRYGVSPDTKSYNIIMEDIVMNRPRANDTFALYQEMIDRGINRNLKTLKELLLASFKSSDPSIVAALASEVMSIPLVKPFSYTAKTTYNALIMALARVVGDVDGALHALKAMSDQGMEIQDNELLSVMSVCNKAENYDASIDLYDRIVEKNGPRGSKIYLIALNAIAMRDWDRALSMLQTITDAGMIIGRNTFNHLLTASIDNKDFEVARSLLERIKARNVKVDSVLFSRLIYAYIDVEDDAGALDTFYYLRDTFGTLTAPVYLAAVKACKREGRYQEAIDLLHDCIASGKVANTSLYNAVLSTCRTAKECSAATKILEEMRAAGVEPDATSYRHVLATASKARQSALVGELFEAIPQDLVPAVLDSSSRTVLLAYLKTDVVKAVALMEQMRKQEGQPEEFLDVKSARALISGLGMQHHWEEALMVLKLTFDKDVSLISAAAKACLWGKQAETAMKLLDDAKAEGLKFDQVALGTALKVAWYGNFYPRGVEYLEDFERLGFPHTNVSVNFGTRLLVKQKMWPETLSLLEEVERLEAVSYDWRTLDFIRDAIQETGEMEKSEEAQALMRKIEELETQVNDDVEQSADDEPSAEENEMDIDAMNDAHFTASYLNRTRVAFESMVAT